MPDRQLVTGGPIPGAVVYVDRPVTREELDDFKARWNAFARAAADWGLSSHELQCPTGHHAPVRVESIEDPAQTLAWLCPDCDRQLDADWAGP